MVSSNDDIIDSRDVLARIEELKSEWEEAVNAYPDPDADDVEEHDADDYSLSEDDWSIGLGEDGAREIVTLIELVEEIESHSGDSAEDGATLIRDSYFEEYAKQLAEDIGAVEENASWPAYCIDWERAANDLKMDYTSIDFDGETYWVHS